MLESIFDTPWVYGVSGHVGVNFCSLRVYLGLWEPFFNLKHGFRFNMTFYGVNEESAFLSNCKN